MRIYSINTATGRKVSVRTKVSVDDSGNRQHIVSDFSSGNLLATVSAHGSRWIAFETNGMSNPFPTLIEAVSYIATQLAYTPEPVAAPEFNTEERFGVKVTRLDPLHGVLPKDFSPLVFEADSELTFGEVQHLAQLIGYAWASTVSGEPLSYPIVCDESSFLLYADVTKSPRSEPDVAAAAFLGMLPDILANGTPVRKTNQAGPETKGTRLAPAFPRPIKLTVWSDASR